MMQPTYDNGIWKGAKIKPSSEDYFNLGEKIFQRFKEFPDIIGQIDGKTGKKETFKLMGERAIRCALWLQKQGLKKGDVIGYCSKNQLDSFIPLVASLYIGTIFNPWWDSCLDEDISKYFIELIEPKILFIHENLADPVIKVMKKSDYKLKIIIFGEKSGFESFENILKCQNIEEIKNFQCSKINKPEEPAMIVYTSGTTNNPKGALYSYGTLSYKGNFESKRLLLNTINMWFSGLCWVSSLTFALLSIFTRSTVIVCDSFNEEEACQLIERYKVSWMSMGANVANRFSKSKVALKYDLSSIHHASYGGAAIQQDVVGFLYKIFKNANIFSVYGSTETGVMIAGKINPDKPTSCGYVIPNAEIKIIKLETGEIAGPNTEGEIYWRGPSLMRYYWKNPEATKEAIDSEGWYHTGDLGYYDEDGNFFITDRIKELIKYQLRHVPPGAIELVIQEHPGVKEVAVVAKPSHDDAEVPTAFITKLPNANVTEDEIHEMVKNRLHDRMKLRGGICFLDKMPYTPSGKIAKKELRAMAKKLAVII